MFSIDFTRRDLGVLIAGLRAREDQMFRDAETYKYQGNKEAQFDCIHEWKTAKHLRGRLQEAVRTCQDRERTRVREEAIDRVEWQKEMERDRRDGAGTD